MHEAAQGNPRQVNILCDNALLAAYSQDVLEIEGDVVRESARRLHIEGDGSPFFLPPQKLLLRRLAGMDGSRAFLLVEGAGWRTPTRKVGWRLSANTL